MSNDGDYKYPSRLISAQALNNADFSPVQRSVYKDLVLLLQKDTYLSSSQLKSKVTRCQLHLLVYFD